MITSNEIITFCGKARADFTELSYEVVAGKDPFECYKTAETILAILMLELDLMRRT